MSYQSSQRFQAQHHPREFPSHSHSFVHPHTTNSAGPSAREPGDITHQLSPDPVPPNMDETLEYRSLPPREWDYNEAPSTSDSDEDFFTGQGDIPPSPPSTLSSPYQSAPPSPTTAPSHSPSPPPPPHNGGVRPRIPPLPTVPCHPLCPMTLVQDLRLFAGFVRIGFRTSADYSATIVQPTFHERGPKGKWYYSTKGTAVGIWNSW